jgi:beta-lactamase class A
VGASAAVSDAEANALADDARRMLAVPLMLRLGDKDVSVDKATVASWLEFPVANGKMGLSIKTDAIQQYVGTVQSAAYKAPGATRITTLDGRETGRAVGAAGKGIDLNGAAEQIEAHLRAAKGGTLTLKTVALAPGTTYDRQYSDTSTGLGVLLKDVTAGKNYGVAVIELSGKRRSANANGDKVYLAASTYKLFVAYAVFQLVDAGELHWNDSISGLTADVCLEKMIVNSDNPCATAFGEKIGWARIQTMMRDLGLGSTSLAAGAKYTAANDLALYLQKLGNGTLLPDAHRDVLLGYMKRQIYRKGIPAGTGVTVADKVGFLYGYIHDAGLVYAPNGTYAMVIMTDGSSWTGVADVARQIHQYMTK